MPPRESTGSSQDGAPPLDGTTPRHDEVESPSFDELFPEEACTRIFAEMSVWISVDDCLAAARFIERRPSPTDDPSRKLIIPFPDNDEFQTIFIQCLRWFIPGCRVPPAKVRLATLIDRAITAETATAIRETTFHGRIDLGAAGTIEDFFPTLAVHRADRFFVVDDDEYVIELIQNALRCLRDVIGRVWPTANTSARIQEVGLAQTGGAPGIFHQPYTDGPLLALVEALAFHVFGLRMASPRGINRGYRSFEVVGRPPLDPQLFEITQTLTEEMFRSLK